MTLRLTTSVTQMNDPLTVSDAELGVAEWQYLDTAGELAWQRFSYVPLAHYESAVAHDDHRRDELLVTDGGRYTETHYAWYDPDTDGLLYHTTANDEFANPFFEDELAARNYLERLAEANGTDGYGNLSLQKLRGKKIGKPSKSSLTKPASRISNPENTQRTPMSHSIQVSHVLNPASW